LEHALGFDNQVHGAPGFGTTTFGDANNCGDVIRSAIIDKLEEKYIHEAPNPGLAGQVNDHPHHGYPSFAHWPHWSSVSHQQMYWEWLRRAHSAGLRVMVALALNNSLLAKAANASQYIDDKSSIELQLREIQQFVGRHDDFMRVVRTPEELRATVTSNRLAVILGVETDDLGNLTRRAAQGERITQAHVGAELRALHDLGVRYVLPIHFSNTVLGGYAVNRDLFALSSKEYTGNYPRVRESCREGVHFQLKRAEFSNIEATLLRTRDLGRIIDGQPNYGDPAEGCGHANAMGLTDLGRGALRTMMDLGMMIDIDHMSQLAVTEALNLADARDYPMSSGHNGLLTDDCLGDTPRDPAQCTENKRTREHYERIRRLGGMVGLGHGGKATSFVKGYREVLDIMGNRGVAIGTDVNGLETLPAPDPAAPIVYDASFPRYQFGNRTWDINSRLGANGAELGDGFAHYGLFPDFIRSWTTSRNSAERMTTRSMEAFMSSAEHFARTWEKSQRRAAGAPRTSSSTTSTSWCTHDAAKLHLTDINADGSADLLCRDPNRLWVDYADNRGALQGDNDWFLDTRFCTHKGADLHIADANGDGRADLI
ncbi:MAG TPA: membrane dipeptidase, partial [Polyangiales bacterium]|nr:membrane dipeptidase [Polyangiales bacterium]